MVVGSVCIHLYYTSYACSRCIEKKIIVYGQIENNSVIEIKKSFYSIYFLYQCDVPSNFDDRLNDDNDGEVLMILVVVLLVEEKTEIMIFEDGDTLQKFFYQLKKYVRKQLEKETSVFWGVGELN